MTTSLIRLLSLVCLSVLPSFASISVAYDPPLHPLPEPGIDAGTQALKVQLEERALKFFVENSHPTTGQVRDAAENFTLTPASNRMSSIAATGFGLAVIVNAGTRGLISADYARDYALKTLRFARDHVPRRNGWFSHFVDWETGASFKDSEYSTIDTALFMAGALYAAQIYPGTEIASIVASLYNEMDFMDMLTDGGAKPDKQTISMAYFPGRGYTEAQWDMPAEQMLLLLMALGHPTRPLPPKSWLAWRRDSAVLPNGKVLIGADMMLFIHQYSHLFVDFKKFRDSPTTSVNYYANGKLGTEFNRDTCRKDKAYETYRAGFWGLSAGLTPKGYGGGNPLSYSSTACIGCAAGSVMYFPKTILEDIRGWVNGPYRDKIWGQYGLVDGVDVDQKWFATQVLGITVGPIYMSLANMHDATSFWKVYRSIPEINRALKIAREASASRD